MISIAGLPELRDPVMVVAFEGWNDAGESATQSVEHLLDQFGEGTSIDMDSEAYYDFQLNRPEVERSPGRSAEFRWPTTTITAIRASERNGLRHDIVLVHGIEPNLKWRTFSDELLGLATTMGARLVVLLGAMLADVPHSRPMPITVLADARVSGLFAHDVQTREPDYSGPTGIVGVLHGEGERRGLPVASVWTAIPHYVANSPCPKATVALLRMLEDITGVAVELGELDEESRAWETGVDALVEDDEDLQEYVEQLVEAHDSDELPEASGEAIAREFERYLRNRDSG